MKNLILQKNSYKEKETDPDYKITMKVGEQWKNLGAGWKKEGKNGSFLSLQLNKEREVNGAKFDGWVLITDKDYNEYQMLKEQRTGTHKTTMTVKGKEIELDIPNGDITEF